MKRGIGAFGVLGAFAAASLAACDRGERVTNSAEQYEITNPIKTLTVQAQIASVAVTTGEGPVTVTEVLRYAGTKPVITHAVDEQTLRLTETGCGDGAPPRCHVEYRIRIPEQTAAQITTRAGDVSIRGVAGPVTVTTDGGRVQGDALASDDVNVATRAGQIALTFADAPNLVQAETGVGAIDVRVPGGQPYAVDVSASADASHITVDQDAGAPRRIAARTKAGVVQISPS